MSDIEKRVGIIFANFQHLPISISSGDEIMICGRLESELFVEQYRG